MEIREEIGSNPSNLMETYRIINGTEREVLSDHAASKINENQVYECQIFSSNSLNDLVKIKNGKIFRIEREHEKLFVYSDSPNSKN